MTHHWLFFSGAKWAERGHGKHSRIAISSINPNPNPMYKPQS